MAKEKDISKEAHDEGPPFPVDEQAVRAPSRGLGVSKSSKGFRRFLQVFDIVGGDNMRGIMTSLPFVGFLVILGFLHIANNNLAENYARRISKTEKEVRDLRWHYMESSNRLMKKSRLSEVSKLVQEQGLKELRQPPYIIEEKKQAP
ncbi:MAG: hypothetical protein JST90_17075 [Bacteroidetes bacterium]|nr:hypothetical protein [Bacteroidota bacterium]